MGGKSKSSQTSNTTNNNAETTIIDNRILEDGGYIGGNVNLETAEDANISINTSDYGAVQLALNTVSNVTGSNNKALEMTVTSAFDFAEDVSKEVFDFGSNVVDSSLDLVEDSTENAIKSISNFSGDSLDAVIDAQDDSNDFMLSITSNAIDSINKATSNSYDAFNDVLQSTDTQITNALKFAKESTRSEASLDFQAISENLTKVALYGVGGLAIYMILGKAKK